MKRLERLSEKQFRAWFRGQISSHMSWHEPGLGGDLGYPDVTVSVDGFLVPFELKRRLPRPDEWKTQVRVQDLRPAQMEWHRRFAAADGISGIIVGDRGHRTSETQKSVPTVVAFVVPSREAFSWSDGWTVSPATQRQELHFEDTEASLKRWVKTERLLRDQRRAIRGLEPFDEASLYGLASAPVDEG